MQVDSLFNPLVSSVKTVSKAVRWVPTNLFNANSRSGDDLKSLQAASGIDFEVRSIYRVVLLLLSCNLL